MSCREGTPHQSQPLRSANDLQAQPAHTGIKSTSLALTTPSAPMWCTAATGLMSCRLSGLPPPPRSTHLPLFLACTRYGCKRSTRITSRTMAQLDRCTQLLSQIHRRHMPLVRMAAGLALHEQRQSAVPEGVCMPSKPASRGLPIEPQSKLAACTAAAGTANQPAIVRVDEPVGANKFAVYFTYPEVNNVQ